tara:strand:+ start:259 stop:489 length:231 start_codon:yes stop_codon:yes gene_type:complete
MPLPYRFLFIKLVLLDENLCEITVRDSHNDHLVFSYFADSLFRGQEVIEQYILKRELEDRQYSISFDLRGPATRAA